VNETEKYFKAPLRKEAFEKLKVFLRNPGYFSVFVSGSRGTGKSFAIECVFEEFEKLDKKERVKQGLKAFKHYTSYTFGSSEKEISDVFKKNENGLIILNDIESFSQEQQEILFNAMKTSDGRMGLQKKVFIRLVFTSSESIENLRSGNTTLIPLLWDRISQLLVEFPSFEKEKNHIMTDFRNTWEKMKFNSLIQYGGLTKCPKNTKLELFIENNAGEFKGGFRDLDKLCILYFNYRIFFYGDARKIEESKEDKIVSFVKADFFGKLQTPEQARSELSVFYFEENKTFKVIEARFRHQLRNWAVNQYGGVGKAEKALGLGHGSLKYFSEKKVAAEQKKAEETPLKRKSN
jgi:hypothetical protein